jgi:hypothetical protein
VSVVGRWASRAVRALLRFAYPEYETQHEQLRGMARAVEHLDQRMQKEAHAQDKRLAALSRQIEALPTPAAVKAIGRDVERLRSSVERQGRVTSKALRRGDARTEPSREERRVLLRLERVASGDRPILVGPWCGEVGFELLYWVPFVNWFRQRYDVDPARLIVLSRGGVSSWYAHAATRYVDALDHVSVEQFREATEAAKKQRALTRFDACLLRSVARDRAFGRVRLLHPEAMYRLFWQFWKGNLPARRVEQYTSFAALASPNAADLPPGLPSRYVAVRFYFSNCFPDTQANRAFVSAVVDSLAATTDVVLLNTPFTIDDHVDATVGGHARVHAIGRMPPARNLAIQTAVIRRANAFVGTYGGYAYLAPLCGVPSLAFHSNRTFFQHHRDLAEQVFADLGTPSLMALDVRDADLLRTALQRVAAEPTGAGA